MKESETLRIQALKDYQVLDTAPEVKFDDLALLASQICQTPVAIITLIDEHRQWFKARVGFDFNEVPRDATFCTHAIQMSQPLIVEDTLLDDRFKNMPLVTSGPHIRFYAGVQLKTPTGQNIGTICVLDGKPRKLTPAQIEALQMLARQVIDLFEFCALSRQFFKQEKKLKEALQLVSQSEKSFRTIVDQSPIGIIRLDAQGRYISANAAYVAFLGYSESELKKMSVLDVTHPEDRNMTLQAIAHFVRPDDSLSRFEKRYVTKSGTLVWGQVSSRAVRFDNDVEYQLFAVVENITEIKKHQDARQASEAKLAENEKLLNSVLQTLPVVVFGKDIKHDFKWNIWNKKAEEIFGIQAKDCLGKTDQDFFPKEQADFFRSKDLEAARSLRTVDVPEEPASTPQGQIVLHTLKTVIRDAQGAPSILLGVSEDITARKASEKLILEQQSKLVASAKMSSLGEMAAGVAHEINNPLAIIHARAGQLKATIAEGAFEAKKFTDDLTKIELTADRIAKIVRGLRSFSRSADRDPMVQVSVRQILEDSFELCKERFKHHSVELRVKAETEQTIECRPTQITQVVTNLLGNAFDAVEKITEKWVEVEVQNLGDRISIRVRDSGDGIPHAVAEKIMQPFFSTKELGKGTGLGLSISLGIAHDHHGELRYDAQSKNTCFALELPIKQPKNASKAA